MIPEIVPDKPTRSEGKAAVFRVCRAEPVVGEVYAVPPWVNYHTSSGQYQLMEVTNAYLRFEETFQRHIINVMWDTWYKLRNEGRAKFVRA